MAVELKGVADAGMPYPAGYLDNGDASGEKVRAMRMPEYMEVAIGDTRTAGYFLPRSFDIARLIGRAVAGDEHELVNGEDFPI